MNDDKLKETALEAAIEKSLISQGGYLKGNPQDFNRKSAFDEKTLLAFIQLTQPKNWASYEKLYADSPHATFINNLCKEIKNRGLLAVLRRGFKDRGISFKLCYFKPDNDINDETVDLYNKNILHCTRQLHYSLSSEKSIDIVLFLNGIPLVSLELKNQFTGQNVSNAITQYQFDRNSKDTLFEFKNRVLAHFALDLYDVYMTTRLQGAKTFFLPFNQGSNGAGRVGGKGNPINKAGGYTTSYLWEKVLCKEMLMEILQKYIHLEVKKDKQTKTITKEVMIFPRFHQLDVVTKLVDDIKEKGSGQNYLIQHSAGSGKSNSIAWLAHQLSGLHNSDEQKIFHCVIVLTDRKVLDSQLQDTIYQFDHVAGVVQKIDKSSQQLLEAINANTPIIISTLQKFPIIYKDIAALDKNYAIIIDEAHSSQGGKASASVIKGLSDKVDALAEFAELEHQAEDEQKDNEDRLLEELASHGHHKNLSFFAFTATPKPKTLNRFGKKQADASYQAFHSYSMRQAIEEKFILDVLKNYVTYQSYYQIGKAGSENPVLDSAKGAKAVSNFQSLHPHNISQKTQIIIEHFNNITKRKIDGQAKAMLVTSSRLHAIRYLFEFRKYIKENNYKDIDVLVAFSGDLEDNGQTWSEEKINKTQTGESIKEHQLKEYFNSPDFNILIVAEKYQTGFDEPFLHTMFVDKKLTDVKAVQTLSRLNRTMKGKTDTFILDFVNEVKDIQTSFQQFYQTTILEREVEPNELYKLKNILEESQIFRDSEIDSFADIYYSSDENLQDLGKLSSWVKPAIDRFKMKDSDEKEQIKSVIVNFVRMYAFVIQVVRLYDKDLQKFYVYALFLNKCLKGELGTKVSIDDKLLLEFYKMQKTYEGNILLQDEDGLVSAPSGGSGKGDKAQETLSDIIDKFNLRFGTNFTETDKILAQIIEDMKRDDYIVGAAKEGNRQTYEGLFKKAFEAAIMSRYAQNDQFFKELFNDEEKLNFIRANVFNALYNNVKNNDYQLSS